MWYELGHKPEPGSPLESAYMLLFQIQEQQRFYGHMLVVKSILTAPLQTVEGANIGNDLEEIVDKYVERMFPFHEADAKSEKKKLREALEEWITKNPVLEVTPLETMSGAIKKARRQSKMRTLSDVANTMVNRRIK